MPFLSLSVLICFFCPDPKAGEFFPGMWRFLSIQKSYLPVFLLKTTEFCNGITFVKRVSGKNETTMARTVYYYRLAEAEEIKKAYSSWVGKLAHIGNGKIETLKQIVIRPAREMMIFGKKEKAYKVFFEFENKKCFSAYAFMINNGLTPIVNISSDVLSQSDSKQSA
jgi:hypothetical protein